MCVRSYFSVTCFWSGERKPVITLDVGAASTCPLKIVHPINLCHVTTEASVVGVSVKVIDHARFTQATMCGLMAYVEIIQFIIHEGAVF